MKVYALLVIIGCLYGFGFGSLAVAIIDPDLSPKVRWFAFGALAVLTVVSVAVASQLVSLLR